MKTFKTATLALAVAGALALSGNAQAYEAGDILFRVGYAKVMPDDGSDPLLGSGGLGLIAGADGAAAKDSSQLGLTIAYMVTDNIGVQVLGALPFEFDIEGTGAIAGAPLGTTTALPPTLTVQYYPDMGGARFQPYVGAGLNYTLFWSSDTTRFTTDTVNGLLGGGVTSTDIDIDNSWGLALEVGADIKINDNWYLNAAAWYIDIDAETTVEVNGAPVYDFTVNVDPWAFLIGVGTKF